MNLTLAANGLASGEYQGFVRVRGATNEIRIPYWYGVASSTPQFMKTFVQPFVQAGSAVTGLFYFRITDAIGIPIGTQPIVTVMSGGATNVNTFVYSGTWNLFYVNATLGSTPGDNIFRVTLGGFTRDVWVTTSAIGAPKADAPDLFFGNVLAGSSKDLTLTVFNFGTAPLNVSAMSIADAQFQLLPPQRRSHCRRGRHRISMYVSLQPSPERRELC